MLTTLRYTALALMAIPLAVGARTHTVKTESDIDRLISQMTLQEKVGQLNQLSGYGYAEPMVGNIRGGAVGSILNETDPVVINRLQREAVEGSRLGIPLVFARDVIHGYHTIFPIPLGQAATWDPEIVRLGAEIAADEASSDGIRWTFSPMVDISRDARWGRVAESFGEDPYLASMLGVAMVRGYQGDDLSRPNRMAACVKHFAGYGASESGRDYNTTWLPEPLLRDVYLPPFRACADAGAATFMCSFNDINGVPSSGNRVLLTDILRGEWGWRGLMCSDWASIQQMIPHGFSADLRQAALHGARAGVDMDMESYAYISNLESLVTSGDLDISVVDELVRNVLRLKLRLGLFDNPYVDESAAGRAYAPESLDAARHCAAEGAVLLSNNGILPLSAAVRKVAVIGPMASAPHDQCGTWSFDMQKEHSVTPLQALTEAFGESNVIYAPGLAYSRDKSTAGFEAAVNAAAAADVVVCCVGEEAVLSGEAHCRADISLPGAQTALLRAVKAAGKPVVIVVMAGRPLTIPEEVDMADAVLYTFHGGTMAGPAIADVLTGAVNPSGKLPCCLPRMSGQVPIYYAHKNTGRPAEGIMLIDEIPLEASQTSTGCTSFHLDAGDGPLYPFGYGMSYTTFGYADVCLSAPTCPTDGEVTVTCRVTNTGTRPGSEVVQLYIRDRVASLVRPVRELKGFDRITLAAGESRDVTFILKASDLGFHDLQGRYVVEPGDFDVWVATDSASGVPATLTLTD